MNKQLDTKLVLKLYEKKDGLYLDNGKQKIKITTQDGKILNDLTEREYEFVKDYI